MNLYTALPTGPSGRVLALAILLVVLAVLWLGVVAPLNDWYDARAEHLAQQRTLLTHMSRLAAALPELERRARGSGPDQSPARGTVSDALAAADTEQRLERLAADAGTEIVSTETLTPEQGDGVRRIRLRLMLHADWPVLLRFLGSIETAETPLLVDDLDIQSDGKEADGAPNMRAAFSVIALRGGARPRITP